jgi:2-C-methyl-D-erythritol 4-phosphate cytidylyltransferase / 2-C-methyl-D-erythritol 2,4-cyclodiphosphate synthase
MELAGRTMTGVCAIVVAAGRGQRYGSSTPKQYLTLAGKPVLRYALEALVHHPAIDGVLAVIHPDDRDLYDRSAEGLSLIDPVAGGATRQESVLNGLAALERRSPDRVLIHDGARPMLSAALIDRTIAALEAADGAVAGLPLSDTIKRTEAGRIVATLPRESLWRAQTPQAFRFAPFLAAHRACAGMALTDDGAVGEAAGLNVAVVAGAEDNIKVTEAGDLERLERVLAGGSGETRTAFGYDVHRFGPGEAVMLGGVRIAHTAGLVGHSDADVVLHAITDALLGTIGAGDIGQHFPPSDPRWRGADSAAFLRHAARLVRERGGRIIHLDVTVVCERPRIGPHRDQIVARISEIAGLTTDRVSVKATTTEGLGFTGRAEGIAANALASVVLPARGS